MNDEALEALLRRYRPLGPPDALRRQITAAARPSRMRPRDWLPVAAAAILAVAFSWLAGIERQRLSANVTPVPPIDQQSPLDIEGPLR